jgi:hypothetical protein
MLISTRTETQNKTDQQEESLKERLRGQLLDNPKEIVHVIIIVAIISANFFRICE